MLLRFLGGLITWTLTIPVTATVSGPQAAAQAVPQAGAAVPPPGTCDPRAGVPADLLQFLTGGWTGTGQFATGRPIEADVSFTPDLDNQWLVYRHADRAPGRYKVLGMWGCERSQRQLVMTLHDNGGGFRMFASDGWLNGTVVFHRSTGVASNAASANSQERFTFARQPDDTFKMTYETTADGTTWKLGDWLVFRRKR